MDSRQQPVRSRPAPGDARQARVRVRPMERLGSGPVVFGPAENDAGDHRRPCNLGTAGGDGSCYSSPARPAVRRSALKLEGDGCGTKEAKGTKVESGQVTLQEARQVAAALRHLVSAVFFRAAAIGGRGPVQGGSRSGRSIRNVSCSGPSGRRNPVDLSD